MEIRALVLSHKSIRVITPDFCFEIKRMGSTEPKYVDSGVNTFAFIW